MKDSKGADEPIRDEGQPSVSILIPVHNGLNFTRACLESILAAPDAALVLEIIIIDDGSTDGTAEYLDGLGTTVRVLQTGTEKSFAEKLNMAAPLACGEYLCFLNNDTTVISGWLKSLLAAARDDPGTAVVGNRQVNPVTGLIDHAGTFFNSNGCPLHLYRGQPADFWPALLSQEFQALTAACWLIAKRTFLELGGFDPVFRNGWEDVDFCLRARRRGYKVFYQAESVIYHHGRSTPGRKDHEKANSEYFQCKWRGAIVPDLDDFYQVPKPEPKLEPQPELKPEPKPELVSAPVPEELSHIERRYAEVERLHVRHPLIAGLLRAVIRLATSIAKQINKISK